MSITKKEQQTIEFYDQGAAKFIGSLRSDEKPSFWVDELAYFQTLVPAGTILDVGVGKGREARALIDAGYEYRGVEPADGLRKVLEQQFPDQTFVSETVYDWQFAPATFDGVWCSAMLLHVPPASIDHVLRQIKKVMKPGAVAFFSLASGSGEYFDVKTGRFFYLYELDEFAAILDRNGFAIEQQATKKHAAQSRAWLQSWLTFFVRG